MSTETTATEKTTTESKTLEPALKHARRKKMRVEARKKRSEKIKNDPEFAKAYFDRKSKSSTAKKVAFRKKISGKK